MLLVSVLLPLLDYSISVVSCQLIGWYNMYNFQNQLKETAMPTTMLRIDWKGNFEKGDEKATRKLGFNCNTLDAAHEIIEGYVNAQTAKGWKLIDNEVKVSTPK